MKVRLKRDMKGWRYAFGAPKGVPYFFAKGSEGLVISTSTMYDADKETFTQVYYTQIDVFQPDTIIMVELKDVDIVDKKANDKSMMINKKKSPQW